MSAEPLALPSLSPSGEALARLRFLSPELRGAACAELAADRFVVARADAAPFRGRLREVIDEAVETALAARGALPPSVALDAPLDAVVAEQLMRTRALGAKGLVIVPPPLALRAGRDNVLGADDSLTLRAWLAASMHGSVRVILDADDARVELLAPRPLASFLPPKPAPQPVSGPPARAEPERPVASAPGPAALPIIVAAAAAPSPAAPPVVVAVGPAPLASRPSQRVIDAAGWRAHAMSLDAARGPRPVSVIEKLFAEHYCPLLGPATSGLADAAVREVVDTFRSSFEHSYRDAFAALCVTGKRPPMVFDVPEIAGRVARLSGARKVSLVLVDGMRFDLGRMVTERVSAEVAGHAVPIESFLLWAALPTSTPTQLSLLARGADGLSDGPPSDGEPMIERGRGVSTLRRERVGVREILKLDLIEARLRTAGPAVDERLDQLADEAAPVLVRYIQSLPPRTLVFVFGDHGFRLPVLDGGRATGPALQGGASPEEVLVHGAAFLTDALQ